MLDRTSKNNLLTKSLRPTKDTSTKVNTDTAAKSGKSEQLKIKPPNFQTARVLIVGTAPYVQNNMSERNITQMREKQVAGSQAKSKRNRVPKDFDAAYRGAMHLSREGWNGIPTAAFRAAMISACRTIDFKMTLAKLSLFIQPDGFDNRDGQGLTKIIGKSHPFEMTVRLATGVCDIACRPMFDEWSAWVTLRWDADTFSATDIVNLLARAGAHCGIGAGRPDSKESAGMGWGTFEVKTDN